MSSSVFKEYPATNDENDKLNSSLVIVLNKNGSVSVDQKALRTLLGNESGDTSVSVIRVTSPTPSLEEEIEKEKKEKLKLSFPSNNDSDDDEEYENEMDDKMERMSNSNVSKIEDQAPHVSISVEEFYPPEDTKKLVADILQYAGMTSHLALDTDYEFKRYVIQNDHCYTPLTSPSQLHSSRSESPLHGNDPLTVRQKLQTQRQELISKLNEESSFDEEKSENVFESTSSSEELSVSESENDRDSDLDYNINERAMRSKRGARKSSRGFSRSSSNNNRCGLKVLKKRQSMSLVADRDVDLTAEFDSKDESGNTSSLVKKRKFFKKNVKGGLNTSTSTSINIKNFMKSTQVKSTPKHGNKIRSTICDKNEQEPSSKLIDFEQKATSDTTTTLGKIDIKSAISIPTLSIPSGSNSKPAPPKKDKKPLAHVEALFTDMTSLFSTPDIIKKVGGADGSTKADCSSPPPLVLNKTFMPLTPSNAKKQQLPAQISVQTHNSSAETDKFQFDLIDSIVKGELDKNNSINTNSMTEDIPNIVKMLENPDQSIDPELLNNVIGISSSQGNSSTTISTSSGIINTNIPTTALDDNNLDDLANADLLEELSSAEGLTEDLLQHVAELAENKHLQEVIDKQVLGVKNQSTVIDEIPPLIVMTQQLSTSTLPQVQSIEEKESPFVKLAQQKQLVKEANVTPSMRREPIKIIRSDGRVITLPPIEAPATRGAKRRAQNTPTSNATTGSKSSSSTPPSFSLLSKIPFIEQEQLNVPTLPVIPTKISYLNEDPKIIPKKGVPKLEKDLNSKNIRRASTTPSVAESEDNMDSDESWNSEDDPDRLWCICKQPHNNRFMICCDSCEDWFHGKCVNITKAMGQQMEEDGIEWTCPNCVKKISNQKNTSHGSKDELGTLLQSDKIISSLESNLSKCIVCKKQARPNSIYCSDDCIRKHAKISVVSVKPTAHQRVNSSSPPPLQPVDTPKKSEQNVSGNLKIEKTVKRIGVLKNKYDRVIVYNKITGKCLTGDSAPTLSNLKQWLQENPNYDVVQPGSVQAQAFKAKQSQLQQLSKDLNVKKQQEQSESQKQKIQSQLKIGTHKQIIFVNPHKSNSVISSQPCSSNNKPQLQPSTIKGKIISHVLKNPTIQTPAQVKPQVILNRSISSEKSVQKNIQTKSRKLSSGDSKVQPSPSKNEPEPIRVNVRRTLKEQLSLRMNEVTDSEKKLSDDEIAKYALETENEMFSLFNKDTGAKYKAKYRSLMFNIKDRKNLSLFQKICNKSILPKQLVRMSADELASQELARWRENENKHQLEMIKKSELDLLACAKNYVLKTHKGEEVIESRISDRVTIDPLIAVEDVVSILNNSAVSSTSEAASLSSVKIPHSSMVTPSKDHLDKSDKIKDLTSSNKSHSSSSKKKDREKESRGHDRNKHESSRNKSSKHKRKRSRDRRSRSRDKEERRSSKEKERDRDRDSGRKEKESNRDDKKDKMKEKEKEINKNSKTVSSSTKEKESTNVKKNNDLKIQKDPLKSIVVKKDEVYNLVDKILEASSSIDKTILSADELKKSKTVLESPPLTDIKKSSLVIENDQEPSSTVTIPTPPEHIYDNRDNYNLNSIANIWTGSINMVDVATFHITAQPVSGDCDEIAKDLPVALDVVGRISPDTVWDYINKIKKSFNKEILIIRLGAMADSEKMPYFALYSYLDTRKRLGVVKTSSTRIKDFYILPLAAHKSLPSILLPIHGSGFIEGDSRPDLLLGIIVKIKTKRTTQLTISGTLPAKIKRSVNCKSDTLTPLSNNDDNFTPPSSPKEVGKINLTETRSKLTLGLPKSSKDVSPVLPIPILLPKVSNLDDDEPYSPGGSDDDDVASDIPLLPSLNHSSISGLDSDDIQRKMEELNRQIEAQKMEIAGILNKEHDDLDEPYSPSRPVTPPTPPPVSTITSLANISIPSNLQEILASIKGVASASQPADKSSNLTSSPPPPPTIGALTSAIPDIEDEEYTPTAPTVSIYKSLDYIPNKTASAYIPPSTISLTPTVGTSSNGTGTSKLAQLSEAELLSMVPDDALIDDITTVNKEKKMESLDNEPLSKKSKWDDNEPPPPGLEDEYDPL